MKHLLINSKKFHMAIPSKNIFVIDEIFKNIQLMNIILDILLAYQKFQD